MRKIVQIGLASLMLSAVATLSTPAAAADAKAVLDACDRTAGCSYAQSKDGSIQGCSSGQSGVCFDCPADGKRQCHSTTIKAPKGNKTATGASDKVLGALTAPPTGKSKGATGVGNRPKVRQTKQSGQKLETAKGTEKVKNERISGKQVDDKKQSSGKRH